MAEILGNKEYVASQREHFENVSRSTNEELKDQFTDHFLLCMTDDPSNPKMWKRYANEDKGAVFRIECLPKIDNVFCIAQPVTYSATPPTFGTKKEWLNFIEGGKGIEVERLYKEIVTWKHTDWAEEKEWRVILIEKKNRGLPHTNIPLNREELPEIYLGSAILPEHRHQIMQLVDTAYPFTRVISL